MVIRLSSACGCASFLLSEQFSVGVFDLLTELPGLEMGSIQVGCLKRDFSHSTWGL
jgi:hypothetical protein